MPLSLQHAFGFVVGGILSLSPSQAVAEAPPVGSPQWNMLQPYVDFIVAMKSPNGRSGCCNMADGRGDIEERTVGAQYQVRITQELYPNAKIPPEGLWIDVDPNTILTPEAAYAHCAPVRASKKEHTCVQPPFNVLWLNISTLKPFCYIRRELTF